MSAALAFSHGANDAQKSVGVIAALLLADGQIDTLAAPTWAKLVCAAALTAGTALGGWRIIRTVGRRIYRIRPIEGSGQPDRVRRRHLRCLARRGAGVHDPGGRVLGRRRSASGDGAGTTCTGRWCARWGSPGSSRCPPPLLWPWPRSGSGSWWHEATSLVPARDARRARAAAPPARGDDRGRRRLRGLGRRRRGRGGGRARRRAGGRTRRSGSC